MPPVYSINEDDDNDSLLSSENSDDTDESYCHTHRSCSRYASCNRTKHRSTSIDLNMSKPKKGDIRSINTQLNQRQKYDGTKWRRICSYSNCLLYLNGGIYYKKWLCKKHYLLTSTNNKSIPQKKSKARQSNNTFQQHKRGDIRLKDNGTQEKYTGRVWRPVCKYNNCISFVVLHGYCHRHDIEMRKKKSEIISSLNECLQPSQSQITSSIDISIPKPKKGDIQCVRQQWNGTKWYSLCQYYTRDCSRRSLGIKYRNLCDAHFKQYQQNLKTSSSSKIQRKRFINDDIIIPTSTSINEQTRRISSQVEHSVQTDVTCPLDSIDLRQGCILIDDDGPKDSYVCESPQLMVYIKKEDDDFLISKRKFRMDINSLPINCKLELTKVEI